MKKETILRGTYDMESVMIFLQKVNIDTISQKRRKNIHMKTMINTIAKTSRHFDSEEKKYY